MIAIVRAKMITKAPVIERINCLNDRSLALPNVAIREVSKVIIETQPAIKDMVFAAVYTGLLYFLYLIKFIIANVKVVKV